MAKKKKPSHSPSPPASDQSPASRKKTSTGKKPASKRKLAKSKADPAESGNAIQAQKQESFPIIGIGASAGGLAALKTFFANIPADSGLAFVIVVHLSPEHKSHLAELLQPHVAVPVQQVSETMPLEPNHVYVIPPNANLDTIDTHLRLSDLEARRRERAPIDHFFRTLAKTHDGSAIGVILTGTGSDGTLGLREIKEMGGLTVVQDPADAEYDGMPQSAVATGLVDLILPLARIPEAILSFTRIQPRIPNLDEEAENLSHSDGQLLQKIFALLRARTGRDFSRYKRSTILRRIQRRMQLRRIEVLSVYLESLRTQADEAQLLADDLLICVTNFFRDPEVFHTLETEVIPKLFKDHGGGEHIRIWSVGCATGEEAYSLAMLMMEASEGLETPPLLQLFASDLHESSLLRARDGFYPGDIETDVSPERLRRFFYKEDGGYRIRKEVREMVVFSPHNLLSDPPFSRLHLISCRNLLIYLQREVQRDVIDIFHYALQPEGYLLLGSSETIETNNLFRLENKKRCIYRKRNVPGPEPRLPVFPLTQPRFPSENKGTGRAGEPAAFGFLHQRMVERFAPPSLLVSPDDKVVHLSEHAGRYLVLPGGEMTANVFKLVREEFRIELRSGLQAVRKQRAPVIIAPLMVRFEGESHPVSIQFRPALEPQQEGFVLVIFEEHTGGELAAATAPDYSLQALRSGEDEHQQELENALNMARQQLQSIVEEYETGQEELKASNEELQSANEELRSTLEELETSKEELQSMNEELQTVNQENRHKVDELAQLTSDLQNLMAATEIATLFLDRDLRILRFTPRVADLFNVRPADRGRALSDFSHRLGYDDFIADARRVLERLIPVEREVQDEAGHAYLTRMLPYRSTQDRIEGVVITFVDITVRVLAEHDLRQSEERFRALVDASAQMVWTVNAKGLLEEDSPTWRAFTGQTFDQAEGEGWLEAIHPEDHDQVDGQWREALQTGQPWATEFRVRHAPSQEYRWVTIRLVPLESADQAIRGWVGMSIDVADQKLAEEQLRDLNESLEKQVAQRTEMLDILQHITRAANEAISAKEAMLAALVRIAQYNGWHIGHVWQLAPDGSGEMTSSGIWHVTDQYELPRKKLNEFQRRTESIRYAPGEELIGRVAESCEPKWIDDIEAYHQWNRGDAHALQLRAMIAFPVTAAGRVAAVLEFFSNHPSKREEPFMEIMPDVGIQLGHAIERRRLEEAIDSASTEQQRRIGQDLHDGVAQQITGCGLLANNLRQLLATEESPHTEEAEKLVNYLSDATRQVRDLSRGLMPVEVDGEGLMQSLSELAVHVREMYATDCEFVCEQAVFLEDNEVATHLYRIAQEAAQNAAKHGDPDSIEISLGQQGDSIVLTVRDNGSGIPKHAPIGSGQRIMRHRAALIGGEFDIQSRDGQGVEVTCRVELPTA